MEHRTRNIAATLNWIILLMFGCAATGAILMIPERVREALQAIVMAFEWSTSTVLWTAGITLPVALVATLLIAGYVGIQFARAARLKQDLNAAEVRHRNAEAARAEREARIWVDIAPPGHQVYKSEIGGGPGSLTTPLHLQPGRTNGGPIDISLEELARWQLNQLVHGPARQRGPDGAVPRIEPPQGGLPPLLPALNQAERILIVGPSKAGKTTLLQWLIDQRRQFSQVFVIDPHGEPPKWGDVAGFGAGRKFEAIEQVLNSLIFEMTMRYQRRASGDTGYHKLTIVIDEWRAIVKQIDGAGTMLGELLTEARKANMDLVVGSHTDRVKGMGLEGEGDLRSGFTVCRLHYNQTTGERKAIIAHPGGEPQEHQLPGPYQEPVSIPDPTAIRLPPPMSAEERQVVQLVMQGASNYAICNQIWGNRSKTYYDRIEEIRAKFGV